MNKSAAWKTRALDVVFPRVCQGCSAEVCEGDHYLCWDCRSSFLQVEPPMCQCCGAPAAGAIDHAYRCYACSSRTMYFDQARSPWLYDGRVRDLMCRMKYTGAFWLLQDFGQWLNACYETFFARRQPDWVTWVPLHWSRRVRRGFNQAALLVEALKSCQPEMKSARLLKKTRNTPSQTRLTASQRLTNVKGSFEVLQPDRIFQSRILLIDDVMTTGSTVNEAARVLRDAGAAEILILTLARGGS